MAKIKIYRSKNFIGFARKMKIFLDGQKVVSIANGRIEEVEVPVGNHELKCRQDFTTVSNVRTFTIGADETKGFTVSYARP